MLFNQQQCFIYSTASFLSKLRAKKVEKLCILIIKQLQQMTAYRNFENEIPETTISGFADIKRIKILMPTDPNFFDM
jgi:hypothetical protein